MHLNICSEGRSYYEVKINTANNNEEARRKLLEVVKRVYSLEGSDGSQMCTSLETH